MLIMLVLMTMTDEVKSLLLSDIGTNIFMNLFIELIVPAFAEDIVTISNLIRHVIYT